MVEQFALGIKNMNIFITFFFVVSACRFVMDVIFFNLLTRVQLSLLLHYRKSRVLLSTAGACSLIKKKKKYCTVLLFENS